MSGPEALCDSSRVREKIMRHLYYPLRIKEFVIIRCLQKTS